MDKLHVLLVTSWDTVCGIAEMSKLLIDGVKVADSEIELYPYAEALDPEWMFSTLATDLKHTHWDILHLQHHDALHAAWQAEHIVRAQELGLKVVVTFHDTFSGASDQPNSAKAHALHDVADAFIAHEEVQDLPKAIHWRHGVPAIKKPATLPPARTRRPIIGSAGFNFGWKNFDLLCEAAALAGWRVLLIGPNFTEEDVKRWQQWQPDGIFPAVHCMPSQAQVVSYLSACDATAFLHNNANTGVSGSVRFGIAARKPCLLMDDCRQFMDLMFDPGLRESFYWTRYCTETIAEDISRLPSVKFDHKLCALAERDSYLHVGKKYAELYRRLVDAD